MKQHYHPHSLDPGDPKTLDFLKNKGSVSIFGNGVRFRKCHSPFHTFLEGHKIGSISRNLNGSESRRTKTLAASFIFVNHKLPYLIDGGFSILHLIVFCKTGFH